MDPGRAVHSQTDRSDDADGQDGAAVLRHQQCGHPVRDHGGGRDLTPDGGDQQLDKPLQDRKYQELQGLLYPGGDGVGSDPDPLRRCVLWNMAIKLKVTECEKYTH